jgi:N-methylhydantoinase A
MHLELICDSDTVSSASGHRVKTTARDSATVWRLGVDIGGTFTDVVVERGGERHTAKVLTTFRAPEEGLIDGVMSALRSAGLQPNHIASITHGTTLATNALIERRGARTALITTAGFRDVLEIGTETRFDHYDLDIDKPAPLIPRELRYTVLERMSAKGEVLTPLDLAAVDRIAAELVRQRIESIAVCLLHSFVRSDHENHVRERLKKLLPSLSVSLSSEVSPEIREYERFSTTAMNAYLQPQVAGYLSSLQRRLQRLGFTCPVFLMLSNGGLTNLGTAMRFPVRLVESGPAGGVILASHIAKECGLSKILSFDMGGTTAKICLFDDGAPSTIRDFEVARAYRFKRGSGLPLRIPVVEMVEIGAGGGSLARISGVGLIAVGPESAGSEPGPACYGRGGTGATVTDANVLLGRIDPDAFAGGKIALDVEAAKAAMRANIADKLSVEPSAAALGVIEMVDENMANAAREHAAERGLDVSGGRTMIAFGGSAPLHAARLAVKLGIDQVVIPVDAGVASAVGFLRAPVAYEVLRSKAYRLTQFDAAAVEKLLDQMTEEALSFVRSGSGDAPLTVRRRAFMRYLGQRHEIVVVLPDQPLTAAEPARLRRAFEESYFQQFGRTIAKLDVEALSWSVIVQTAGAEVRLAEAVRPTPLAGNSVARALLDPGTGERINALIVRRDQLPVGTVFDGPAMVVEDDTSTLVPEGFRLTVNGHAYLVMQRQREMRP